MIDFKSEFDLQQSNKIQRQMKQLRTATVSLFSICLLLSFCILAFVVYHFNQTVTSEDLEARIGSVANQGKTILGDQETRIGSVEKGVNSLGHRVAGDYWNNSGTVFSLKQIDLCLDTMGHINKKSIELYPCHLIGGNQEWQFTTNNELKNRKSCVSFDNVTNSALIEPCTISSKQQWKLSNGLLRNPVYDKCLQSNGTKISSENCNPAESSQMFELHILYTIDRYCTFKQGSFLFPRNGKWAISKNGRFSRNAACLTYTEQDSSYREYDCFNEDSQKWEFTVDGQLRNFIFDVCVGLENNKIVVKKCDLKLSSQRWYCI